MDFLEGARIRTLGKEDLEAIVSIDEKVLGGLSSGAIGTCSNAFVR
jgi:hypothetical protein